MSQRTGGPKSVLDSNAQGALSGDVRVDDGERVYVAEGDLVAGKYRIERILGVGGVGFVVAARHTDLGGHFALKFLKKRFLNDKAIVERFTREAKAASRIKSDYVARVYDVGAHGRAPFIVMEHLVGRDLAAVLAERGAFAIGEAVEYAVQACAALAVAHASGIIHRDIKPENLFLVDEEGLPTIKLLDFGISKMALASDRPKDEWGPEGEPITGTAICGTPFYMSPEQIRSTATVDARSDVWSLGMVLYEMLAATTAFQAESVMDVCTAILDQEPRPLSDLRHEVPSGLSDVVAHCLQKDPANRFASVAELAVALLPFAPPRALAIAEGSAWIRRAAIHTLGAPAAPVGHPQALGPGDGRVSGGYGAPVAAVAVPAASGPAQSSPTPAQGMSRSVLARWPQRRWVALGAGAALALGSIAALGAAHLLRSHNGDTAKPSTATASVPAEPVLATPLPQPSLISGPSEERSAPSVPSHPLPAASPAEAPPAPPGHALAPFRPHVAPARVQPSAKPALSSPTESSPAPPVISPPLSPGRPDIGY
jgi:eukaryotic-like serine/threonine-protein kinase